VLLVVAALVTACVIFFRVNHVTVEGNARYTAAEIEAASGIQTGENLITLPKSRIAARIRVALPYVSSVSITQILPDTVALTVTEHQAAAAVADSAGNWWLIAARGKLLEQVSAPGSALVVKGMTAQSPVPGESLTVEEKRQGRLEYVLSLLEALEDQGFLPDCTQLDCSAAGELLLQYRDFQLKLPTTGDFPYLLSLLDGVFDSGRVSRDDSGSFDFTVIDGKVYYRRSS